MTEPTLARSAPPNEPTASHPPPRRRRRRKRPAGSGDRRRLLRRDRREGRDRAHRRSGPPALRRHRGLRRAPHRGARAGRRVLPAGLSRPAVVYRLQEHEEVRDMKPEGRAVPIGHYCRTYRGSPEETAKTDSSGRAKSPAIATSSRKRRRVSYTGPAGRSRPGPSRPKRWKCHPAEETLPQDDGPVNHQLRSTK